MIRLTPSAVKTLQGMLQSHPEAGHGLRLSVEHGGCAGLQYGMKLDAIQEGDEVVEEAGVRVLVAPASQNFLRGSTLDYCDDLTGTGFRLQNPNAVRSCGCGTSFEPAPGEESAAGAHA